MESLVEGIALFLEFICFYYTVRMFLQKGLRPTIFDVLFFLLYLSINFFLPDNPFVWLGGFFFIFFYYRVLFPQEMLIMDLLLCSWCYFFIILIQLIASAWLLLPLRSSYPEYETIFGNLITFILLVILLKIPLFQNSYQKVSKTSFPFRMLFINSFIILYVILFFFKLNTIFYYANIISFVTALFFLLLADALLLYYDQKLYYSRKLIQSYEKNLPIYETLIAEIRNSQHSYSNRIQTLRQLPDICSTYEELSAALKQSAASYAQPLHAYPLLLIKQPLLAASLYNLSSRAETNGIQVQYDVTDTDFTCTASEEDLSDFTTILLQNAIEASEPGSYIYIHMFRKDTHFNFVIRNRLPEEIPASEIRKFFQEGYSTKKSDIKSDGLPHGIGLYYLLNAIQKYHGTISADCISFQGEFWMNIELVI